MGKIIFNCTVFLLCLCYPEIISAQWSDDFSDGDFLHQPAWQGNTDRFIVENGWLRLDDAAAGVSYLSVASDIAKEASWEFAVKLDFNPSSSNYTKVYLMSDNPDLTGPLNGYYLRLGGTDDDICLFRQNGNTVEKLITGRAKILDVSSSHARILTTRDAQGNWTVQSDITGGNNYTIEGESFDNQVKASAYFGVVCVYTVTRSKAFYFDDFRVNGQAFADRELPEIIDYRLNGYLINICFSKEINPINDYGKYFSIVGGTHLPTGVQKEELTCFSLSFPGQPQCGIQHHLKVSGLMDQNQNIMRDTVLNIIFPCPVLPNDVVINEVMANPSPVVHLPEYEYIEIHNRSDKDIELEGWTLTYGQTSKIFPSFLFGAKSRLLLVHPNAAPDMESFGPVMPILGSMTAIANSGQYLMLQDDAGTVISWIDFNTDWYKDTQKSNGGWSLELIDPEQTCSGAFNWKASVDRNGGTPGKENSVFSRNADDRLPQIRHIATPDQHTIVLHVSKSLAGFIPDITLFTLKPEISIRDIEITGKHFNQLQLNLQDALQEKQWYDLSVESDIEDCAGYKIPSARFHFSLPEYTDSLDVIINEILFNPFPEGYTFIELYNRSKKAVNVSDLQISMRDNNGKLSNPAGLTEDPFLLMPEQYLVVSRNTDHILQQYDAGPPECFLQLMSMPSLTKESGRLVLLNKSLHVIDEVHYNSKQHVDFLNIGSGVSLERIHPDRNSLDQNNWHTAAQTAGFATPGKKNSQYTDPEYGQNAVTLLPEVFSPDNDGFDDVLDICYHFETPSLMGEVIIFDAYGRKIRQLIRQQIMQTEGIITWDGTDENNRKALTGVYIVYFHAYNSSGFSKTYKLPCVLAGKKR
ncbi:MAG: lamin tail domain-containing protein [Bacteroidales bacterium]|jgi:hypothetical protein|nr:lamin tail domain-containing protein [Bacteroidales bacterium]